VRASCFSHFFCCGAELLLRVISQTLGHTTLYDYIMSLQSSHWTIFKGPT
jgi:hypothetical protein